MSKKILTRQCRVYFSEVVRFNTYTFQCSYRLSLAQVHCQSKVCGVRLLTRKPLVHCHQGSVLLNVKCSPATVFAEAKVRIAAVAVACGSNVSNAVVIAPTPNPVVGRVGLHGPVVHVAC